MMEQILHQKLTQAFTPSHLEVINESAQHAGPATESHFKVIVVSEHFAGMRLIDRHRLVNELLKTQLTQIHALAIHTYTAQEWQDKSTKAPISPKCAH